MKGEDLQTANFRQLCARKQVAKIDFCFRGSLISLELANERLPGLDNQR